jgi:hypothetical protein
MKILRVEQLNENKMWYKTIPEILNWLDQSLIYLGYY